MNAQSNTAMIDPIILPEKAHDEIGVFNPTACLDSTGKIQVVYRSADSSRVTRLARRIIDGMNVSPRVPLTIQVNTGKPETDQFVAAALANSEEDPRFVRLHGEDGWFMTIVGLKLPAYSPGQKALTVCGKVNASFDSVHISQLLTPDDRDDRHVMPLPERIHGKYALLSRPQTPGVDSYVDFYTSQASSVYLSLTDDLSIRPNDKILLSPRQPWEARRIGGVGPQPIRTPQGWLVIYMAIDLNNHYSVGAALLDGQTCQVIARTPNPLLTPDDNFNRRFPVTTFGMQNVIFATTALHAEDEDEVLLLAGCNDIAVGRVVLSHREILGAMDAVSPMSGA